MRTRLHRITVAVLVPLLLAPTAVPAAWTQTAAPDQAGGAPTPVPGQGDRPWPRQALGDGYVITVYQPQIDKWDGTTLEARAAVSVETAASPQQKFGVAWLTARTQIDRQNHLVALDQVQVARVSSSRMRADPQAAHVEAGAGAGAAGAEGPR